MSERLTVTITANDGASKTFTAVGNAATKMGDAVERAGKEGATGLKQIDTQAKTTGSSMDNLAARATAVGAAIGVLGTAVIALGSSYVDQQRQIDGINRLYGEQADSVLELSEGIQDLTKFSNDAARESFLLSSSLSSAYGLSSDQIGILIERSADLAQIYGFTLPDAVQRTSSALRGEGESAERLGLNMSDAALAARALSDGITNWNVPGALSEAEKAAYRFSVFLEDTESTVGAAAAAADTAGGSFRQFANDMGDVGQAVGGFLGPIGQVGAEMAPLALVFPLVTAGAGRMAAALRGTAVAARTAALGTAALGLALSPVGIAIGVVVAAGALLAKNWYDQKQAAESYEASLQSLEGTIELLRRQGDTALADQAQETLDILTEIDDRIEKLAHKKLDEAGGFLDFRDEVIAAGGNMDDALQQWDDLMDAVNTDADFAAAAMSKVNEALADPNIDIRAYLDWVQALAEGADSAFEIDQAIEQIETTPLSDFSINAKEAAAATDTLIGRTLELLSTVDRMDVLRSMYEGVGKAVKEGATAAFEELETAQSSAFSSFLSNGDNILDFWLDFTEGANQGGAAMVESQAQVDAFNAALAQEAEFRALVGLADDLDDAGRALDSVLTTFGQIDALGQRSASAGSIADNLIGPPGELGTVQDLWQRITDGTADAALNQETYNASLTAGVAIQESNLRVQDDLTAMRATQLPLLAEEQLAYEAQIDLISQLPALEQRRALALQDSNVQAQLATQYATAYQASVGEIPEEVATQMILSSAEADPVIADLLTQMGLIEEGADGELRVNFPDGPSVQDSITDLTSAIDDLIEAITGVPPLRIDAEDFASEKFREVMGLVAESDGASSTVFVEGDPQGAFAAIGQALSELGSADGQSGTVFVEGDGTGGSSTIADVLSKLRGADGQSATVKLFASDSASGVIGNVKNALASLDGRTATSYLKTVNITEYQTRGIGPTRAHGGMIDSFAGGGVANWIPFWAGENGPEMAHFAGGGSALIPREGMYAAPPMTYISPANANPGTTTYGGDTWNLHIHGNVYGIDDLAGSLEGAINQRRRAFGSEVQA